MVVKGIRDKVAIIGVGATKYGDFTLHLLFLFNLFFSFAFLRVYKCNMKFLIYSTFRHILMLLKIKKMRLKQFGWEYIIILQDYQAEHLQML